MELALLTRWMDSFLERTSLQVQSLNRKQGKSTNLEGNCMETIDSGEVEVVG